MVILIYATKYFKSAAVCSKYAMLSNWAEWIFMYVQTESAGKTGSRLSWINWMDMKNCSLKQTCEEHGLGCPRVCFARSKE